MDTTKRYILSYIQLIGSRNGFSFYAEGFDAHLMSHFKNKTVYSKSDGSRQVTVEMCDWSNADMNSDTRAALKSMT